MLKKIDKWVVELKKSFNEIMFEFDTPDGAADFYETVRDTIVDDVISVDCKVYARMKKEED